MTAWLKMYKWLFISYTFKEIFVFLLYEQKKR